MLQKIISLALFLFSNITYFAHANTSCDGKERPDLSLALAIDVSGSINANEIRVQMNGYQDAFSHSQIQENLLRSGCECTEVTVILWGKYSKIVHGPHLLQSQEEISKLINFFAQVAETKGELWHTHGLEPYTVPISAINMATDVLRQSEASRMVIDISGDGKIETRVASLDQLREAKQNAEFYGIKINGIPIVRPLTADFLESPFGDQFVTRGNPTLRQPIPSIIQEDLEVVKFYQEELISQPFGRLNPADDYADFPRAVFENLRDETCNVMM